MESMYAIQATIAQVNSKPGHKVPQRRWQDFHPLTVRSKPEGLLNPATMSDILWSIGNQMIATKR